MSITKLAIKLASPLPELDSFNRYLFIGPHPDDIEIGAGATAAKLAESGKAVAFLCCIDGRYGSASVPPEELIPIRQAEAKASAAALGLSDVRFLPFCDGGFTTLASLRPPLQRSWAILSPTSYSAPIRR